MRIATIAPILLMTASFPAWGQAATATADQGIRLQSYALGSYQQPNFGNYGRNQAGITLGSNLNAFHLGRFQPSLDARLSGNFGSVSSLFLGGGPRVAVDLGRLHPYADFLVGYGTLHFTSSSPAYTHDNSYVTSVGGGVDFSLNHRWAVRADVQRQNWNVGTYSPAFHPVQVGIGVRYQFHFKTKNGPE